MCDGAGARNEDFITAWNKVCVLEKLMLYLETLYIKLALISHSLSLGFLNNRWPSLLLKLERKIRWIENLTTFFLWILRLLFLLCGIDTRFIIITGLQLHIIIIYIWLLQKIAFKFKEEKIKPLTTLKLCLTATGTGNGPLKGR